MGSEGPRLKTQHDGTVLLALNALEMDGRVTNFENATGNFDGPLKSHHGFDSDPTFAPCLSSTRHAPCQYGMPPRVPLNSSCNKSSRA